MMNWMIGSRGSIVPSLYTWRESSFPRSATARAGAASARRRGPGARRWPYRSSTMRCVLVTPSAENRKK